MKEDKQLLNFEKKRFLSSQLSIILKINYNNSWSMLGSFEGKVLKASVESEEDLDDEEQNNHQSERNRGTQDPVRENYFKNISPHWKTLLSGNKITFQAPIEGPKLKLTVMETDGESTMYSMRLGFFKT